MSNRIIYEGSDVATQDSNTAGVATPILRIQPKDGSRLQFSNVSKKGNRGVPLYTDLNDSSNADLPNDTELFLAVATPTEEGTEAVSEKEDSIHIRNLRTIGEQQSTDYEHNFLHRLEHSSVTIYQDEELLVMANSSAQVDWANSRLKFGREAVDEQRA